MNLTKDKNVEKFKYNLHLMTLPALIVLGIVMCACNAKESDSDDYSTASAVAVTNFYINANAKVMDDLDSVYFSIDLTHGVVFNADSLPVGTAIDKLVPVISYSSAVDKAVIEMSGGTTREGTVDYIDSPTDSIDFTGKVTLTLTASEASLSKTYTLKVNVHQVAPDSLMWDDVALSTLPSRASNPTAQKTISFNDKVYSLIKEADNSLTLSSCENPSNLNWDKQAISLAFTPDIRSFSASDDALYILDEAGSLYSSSDGISWTDTGVDWITLIGGFSDTVLGLIADGSSIKHDIYPRPSDYTPVEIPEDFPTLGLSDFNSFSSKWAADPIGFFCGGTRDGKYYGTSWAYDGNTWANISNIALPAISNTLIVPYFNYRKTNTSWIQTEYSVWLCIGGKLSDGSINPDVYISYDNGVNWSVADSLLQLPDYVSPGYNADVVICGTPYSADLDAYWKTVSTSSRPPYSTRVDYTIDGSDIDWDCPYIYMFGGHDGSGKLSNTVLRAVLARLTFAPIF